MTTYKINELMKTLDKLFKCGINTTEKVINLKWDDLNRISDFTPTEKSLIMDFKTVIDENYSRKRKVKNGLVEFLAGKEEDENENRKE